MYNTSLKTYYPIYIQPLPLLIALLYLIPKIFQRQRCGGECLRCPDNCAALAATQPAG